MSKNVKVHKTTIILLLIIIITAVKKLVHLGGRDAWRWAGKWPCGLITTHRRRLESTDGLLQWQMFLRQHAETFLQYPRLFHLLLKLNVPNLDTANYSISLAFVQQKLHKNTHFYGTCSRTTVKEITHSLISKCNTFSYWMVFHFPRQIRDTITK